MNKKHYKEVIDNLHLEILHQYESLNKFCKEFGYDRANLCKVFNGYNGQNISIGLFIKICIDLKRLDIPKPQKNFNLSLQEYLEINHTTVLMGIMNLYTS